MLRSLSPRGRKSRCGGMWFVECGEIHGYASHQGPQTLISVHGMN